MDGDARGQEREEAFRFRLRKIDAYLDAGFQIAPLHNVGSQTEYGECRNRPNAYVGYKRVEWHRRRYRLTGRGVDRLLESGSRFPPACLFSVRGGRTGTPSAR